MPEGNNPNPFTPIEFTLAAGGRQQYETASGACIYFAEGPGVPAGGIAFQFDERPEFRVAPGIFIRVQRFDKLRIINKLGVSLSGVVWVSSDPDFLAMMFPMGI